LRFQGKSRLGFYPLAVSEAQRIRRFFLFPDAPSSAIDPCIGDGVALEVITDDADVSRYDIELDGYRAGQARQRIPNIVQGNMLEMQCPVKCCGLLYLNPPYHWTLWQAIKIVDKTEEEDEQGIVTVREKECFSNELTVVYSTGQVAMLK